MTGRCPFLDSGTFRDYKCWCFMITAISFFLLPPHPKVTLVYKPSCLRGIVSHPTECMLSDHTTKVPSLLLVHGSPLQSIQEVTSVLQSPRVCFHWILCSCVLCLSHKWYPQWYLSSDLAHLAQPLQFHPKIRAHLSLWLNCIPLCVLTLAVVNSAGTGVHIYIFILVLYSTGRWT